MEDILVIGQKATAATVAFEDAAVADLFDRMIDQQIPPHRFARAWLHTHPGSSAKPSAVDEVTLRRVFGTCDFSVMATLRVSMMLGAVTSCVVGLFRKESRKVWWGAGVVLSTILLESYVGTLGTLLLGGGVVYLITQSKVKQLPLTVSPAVSA